jgi:serine/threonine protein phosphatase PrpC
MLDIEFAQATDRGRVRTGNEDYLGYTLPENSEQERTHGWLFTLADGVGGHENGEIASRRAVETMLTTFRAAPPNEPLRSLLPRLLQQANTRIFEAGLSMATTLVACALRFDRAVISHVGDSRCYLIRDGQAALLTKDHSVTAEEGQRLLTRSLGSAMFVKVETSEHLLSPGDLLLLCSDGLYGVLSMAGMAGAVSRNGNLEEAARQLVFQANEQDGGDNISVQLIRIQGVARVGMYRGKPYKLR